MANKEAINRMDTSLAMLIVLCIQLLGEKFAEEMKADDEDVIPSFIDGLVESYCDVLDDPGHAEVVAARIDEVWDSWVKINGGNDERPTD